MSFFALLSFLLAAGFLVAAFVRPRVVGTERFRSAMMLFFAALILHDLASMIPFVGLVTMPIGYGLALWSFWDLCLALAAHTASDRSGSDEF
jgi:hypothetical protein